MNGNFMNQDTSDTEVVEETINAYRVQKLEDGTVRFRSGGHVVEAPTYYEAMETYAQGEQVRIEQIPSQLRLDRKQSIHDGHIPLRSLTSSGFTPEEILDGVTAGPLSVALDDLAVNSEHDELCDCYECIQDE